MDREMHNRVVALYWDFRARAEADPEYVRLRSITEELEKKYEVAISGLAAEQREAVELYIAGRESMGRRMLEFVCGEIVDRI